MPLNKDPLLKKLLRAQKSNLFQNLSIFLAESRFLIKQNLCSRNLLVIFVISWTLLEIRDSLKIESKGFLSTTMFWGRWKDKICANLYFVVWIFSHRMIWDKIKIPFMFWKLYLILVIFKITKNECNRISNFFTLHFML